MWTSQLEKNIIKLNRLLDTGRILPHKNRSLFHNTDKVIVVTVRQFLQRLVSHELISR